LAELDQKFDYLIVGGGAAGCVLASRLSEDPAASVLLIEAGPDYGPNLEDWPEDIRDGVGIKPDSHPWGYVLHNDPRPTPLALPRGRIIGGSAAINGCMWLHGSASDYDGWAALGNPGWEFEHILAGYRAAESDPMGGEFHGTDGPIPIFRVPDGEFTPVQKAVTEAAHEFNFPWIDDINGREVQTPGIALNARNQRDYVRMHGGLTYLALARGRTNLRILPDTQIDRILLEGTTARGVLTTSGQEIRARDVIVSSGAYGSPAILLRSGIGPAGHLAEVGIPVAVDLPGVGEHLQDHPAITMPGPFPIKPEYLPGRTVHCPVMILAQSSQSPDEIDLHIYHGQRIEEGIWSMWIDGSVQFARSEGTVRLRSADPDDAPLIDHRHLSDERDLEALADCCEMMADIFDSAIVRQTIEAEPRVRTWPNRDALRAFLRANVSTMFHPSGTCKMGPATDPLTVVDANGCVHGLDGLRVADASIFPQGPRGNTHGPTVASAEVVAAKIRAEA
jgi:choline dehydrogenase